MEQKINVKKNRYEMDMTSGNLFLKIIRFSIPLALMGILQLLYNAADLIVVGNFSGDGEALGAVGSTGSLINLTVNLFMGLSVGTNVICARMFGAGEKERVGKVVHTSIAMSFLIGIFLGVFGIIFSKPLLHLMNNDLELSNLYLKIYFIGLPFNLCYNFAAAILRSVGDTKRPLYFLTISGLVNVLLNLLLVIVFDLSVAGVAIATVVSQLLSFIMIIVTLMRSKECYRLKLSELKISRNELKQIVKIGLPAGIQSSIFSISNVLIQSSVNLFGPVAMNGNTAAQSVEGFVYTSMNAVYHASLAFTGQNYGAKNVKNIKKVTIYSLIIVTLFALIIGQPLFWFGKDVLRIYTTVPEEIEVAYIRLHYLTLPYFLCGIMDVMVGILRGIGYSVMPMIVSIVGVCGFRIIWILLVFYQNTDFSKFTDLNLLYVSYPISWTITFLVHLVTYFVVSRKVFNNMESY